MKYWNSGTQVSEFGKTRFELVETKNNNKGTHILEFRFMSSWSPYSPGTRLFSPGKTIILVQEKDKKFIVVRNLFSSYLTGDVILSTLDVQACLTLTTMPEMLPLLLSSKLSVFPAL